MKEFLERHGSTAAAILTGLWVFAAWRLASMPSPGFLGRIVPGAWILAGALSGKGPVRWWMPVQMVLFTTSAWLWMIWEPGWVFAAAVPVAGLAAWAFARAPGKYGTVRALIPMLFLTLFTAEVNSDEVRFAEIAAGIGHVNSERYGERQYRPGDISDEVGHHTMLFPAIISPGLMAGGDRWLRSVPVLISIGSVSLLASLAGPVPAVACALLYPGISTLGLAMTGWLAAGIFTLWLMGGSFRWRGIVTVLAALLLTALKMRYAGLAAGIILAEYANAKPVRGKWLVPFALVAGVMLFLAVDRYLLGGEVFWVRYGNIETLKLMWINVFHRPAATLSAAGWSLFDPEAGLLPRAPWVIPAFWGLVILARENAALFRRAVIPAALYWFVLIIWSGTTWHGLPAPVGRVFLPLVPPLALGLSKVWSRRETLVLVAVSAMISALVTVFPHGRANYADGTDTLITLAGGRTGFSMVRASSLWLLAAMVPVVSTLLLTGRKRVSTGFITLAVLSVGLALGLTGGIMEAEDLQGGSAAGALIYPEDPDPVVRYFWFGSRERMLELSSPDHIVTLECPPGRAVLLLEASSSGGSLLICGDTLEVGTPMIELPGIYRMIGRREVLPDRPENRMMEACTLLVEAPRGRITVAHCGGAPVYLDRTGLL